MTKKKKEMSLSIYKKNNLLKINNKILEYNVSKFFLEPINN